MADYSDLEITLRKADAASFTAGFRFTTPDDAAEQRSAVDPSFALDAVLLYRDKAADLEPGTYGKKLGDSFFNDAVKAEFVKFRRLAQAAKAGSGLRVRLTVDASAPELHGMHWETLADPEVPASQLFTGDATVISRFLSSSLDSRPIRLRPRADLSALLVVASPSLLGDYQLPTVDPQYAVDAEAALNSDTVKINVTKLAPGGPVSMQEIVDQLSKGDGFDILYLVCHGRLFKNTPQIFLDDTGPISGSELIDRIHGLDNRPRLIVLCSCQSAGKGGVGLSGLGPQLANAGIPAIVAMQGNFTMATAGRFLKEFFTKLMEDGQIDRAISLARGAVRDRDDCWMPVLFTRLRNGRIWYVPGFDNSDNGNFDHWSSICKFVRSGTFVPVIGPDVAEDIWGPSKNHAASILEAEAKNKNIRIEDFPLDISDHRDLAKVTQLLTVHDSLNYAKEMVKESYAVQLDKAYARLLQKPADSLDPKEVLEAIVGKVSDPSFDNDAQRRDPLRIVAGLDAKVFVCAANDSLIENHLRRTTVNNQTKQPVPLVTCWRDETHPPHAPVGSPSVERPYVYYIFGQRAEEDNKQTWVLTEDDFFDYLIRVSSYDLVPSVIKNALLGGSLLLLGFPLDDWKFRVLFRMIMALGGASLLQSFNHVAVQVDPSETTPVRARQARNYLQTYFKDKKIDIYWGTAGDFLRELRKELDKAPIKQKRVA